MRLKIVGLIILLLPLFVFAQGDVPKKSAYFFYLDACPHCHNVNNFFNENGLYEKYDIKKLDASVPANGKFLMQLYGANGYLESQRGGVPVAAFGDKFLIGDKPIVDNFVKEIEAAESTDVPDVPADIVVREGPIAEAARAEAVPAAAAADQSGKKNYFPAIVGALVVITAGALVFLNRK